MGLFDSKRVAYAPPDPEKIFAKIMDWLEANHLSDMGDAPESQLADDFMVGWETTDDFEKKQLGLMAANGQCAPEHLDEVRRLSMMRGVEVWDMMISCARALRAVHADPGSLDGQDTLTFLAKLMSPGLCGIASHGGRSIKNQTQPRGVQQLAPAQQEPTPNSRKAKRKRKNESHFFDKSGPVRNENAEASSKKARKAAKRAEKKKNRRSKRAFLQAQNGDQQPEILTSGPTPAVPVLREAAVWYRSNDNVGAHAASGDHHPQVHSSGGSNDGNNALKDIHS